MMSIFPAHLKLPCFVASGDLFFIQVNRGISGWIFFDDLRNCAISAFAILMQGIPNVVELPKKISAKALGDHGFESRAINRLRSMLARAAAAKIIAAD